MVVDRVVKESYEREGRGIKVLSWARLGSELSMTPTSAKLEIKIEITKKCKPIKEHDFELDPPFILLHPLPNLPNGFDYVYLVILLPFK